MTFPPAPVNLFCRGGFFLVALRAASDRVRTSTDTTNQMNATELHAKAARRLSTMNVADLLEQWDEIEKHPMAPEIACVRGWIMDALEIRNSAAFEAWIDGCPHKGPRDYFQA